MNDKDRRQVADLFTALAELTRVPTGAAADGAYERQCQVALARIHQLHGACEQASIMPSSDDLVVMAKVMRSITARNPIDYPQVQPPEAGPDGDAAGPAGPPAESASPAAGRNWLEMQPEDFALRPAGLF